MRWSSSHGSDASSPRGRCFSPITVIVRSPASSTNVTPRRCGRRSQATWSARLSPRALVRPMPELVVAERREERGLAAEVRELHRRDRAASRRLAPSVSDAWTISPGFGTDSTRRKSIHSTCPMTAARTSHILAAGARWTRMMEAVATIPPFERFYAEHRDAMFGFLARRLGRPAAEDAFQETFLRALRAYDRLEHGRHLRAWIFTIAARVAIDVHRQVERRSVTWRGGPRPRTRGRRTSSSSTWRERAAARGACRGRAPLRLRPALLRDRRGARIVGGRARDRRRRRGSGGCAGRKDSHEGFA